MLFAVDRSVHEEAFAPPTAINCSPHAVELGCTRIQRGVGAEKKATRVLDSSTNSQSDTTSLSCLVLLAKRKEISLDRLAVVHPDVLMLRGSQKMSTIEWMCSVYECMSTLREPTNMLQAPRQWLGPDHCDLIYRRSCPWAGFTFTISPTPPPLTSSFPPPFPPT